MRKASKILTLILIAVLVLSVFAGCGLVGRNVAKYRNAIAFTVGNEEVTVGKLLDTFNSYYNNYYYYISAGYLQPSDLLNMVVSSIVQQYMQIDDYVSTATKETDVTELQKSIHNAEFLTKDEFAYAVKYVNYLAYNAFDQYTDDNISAKFDLEEEETEDTSRDFTEYDKLTDMKGEPAASYAQYTRDQNFVNEEADEYFEDNYPYLDVTSGLNLDGYVYDDTDAEQKAQAEERVRSYNDRRAEDEEDELTLSEYLDILKDTKKQYEETIRNSYGVGLSEFLTNQLGDMVSSCILAKWSYQYYKDIEFEDDLAAKLQENYDILRNAQLADFQINGNFDSFITSLSSSSVLYNNNKDADKYVFVKNILIPFTSDQTTLLTNLQNQLGSNEADKYIAKRNEFAADIVAQYFDSDKYTETDDGKALEDKYFAKDKWFEDKKKEDDEDSLWKATTNVFTYENGELTVNPQGVLGQFFGADGTVSAMEGKDKSETIIELMKRFNTDTAQHTAAYDYVVYVGEDWEDYSHSWVKEFYTAVNEDLVPHDGSAPKEYTLCVSSYGVHIIYLTGKVSESDKIFGKFNFDDRLDTSTQSYQLFKTYFDRQMSIRTQDALEALQKDKLVGDYTQYISINKGLQKFLKDNDFEFDFDEFIKDLVAEL